MFTYSLSQYLFFLLNILLQLMHLFIALLKVLLF